MHIPDSWLSFEISLLAWGLTIIALGLSLRKIKSDDLDKLSNIGAIAAVIFVAQMFNFPIAFGTSGHLLGATLAVFILGLPGAILAIFIVLVVQALIFADGGILALGANTLNMGIIGALVAYGVIILIKKRVSNKKIYYGGVFLSAFLAVVVSSFFAGLELVFSGVTTFGVSIPAILFWHILIGVGEGILSVFIIYYLHQVDFPLLDLEKDQTDPLLSTDKNSNKPMIGIGILLVILSLISLIASSSPDGLEMVGLDLSFNEGTAFELGIADDYSFLGFEGIIGTLLSAVLGIVIIVGLIILPSFYFRERSNKIASSS